MNFKDVYKRQAYGRAVRVGLQVKDDISCAMLSEYSSSYNTLVNGKSIQRIATVKNHDFISIGDFTAYYNNGKIFPFTNVLYDELYSDNIAHDISSVSYTHLLLTSSSNI